MPLKPGKYRSTLALTINDPATARAFEDMARKIEQLARDANSLGGGGDGFKPGMAVFFLGTVDEIPDGWSEVVEMRGRFPRGMESGGTPGDTGGDDTHTHTGDTSNNGSHQHSVGVSGKYGSGSVFATDASSTGSAGGHTHTLNINTASNLPPYVDGIWIRKD